MSAENAVPKNAIDVEEILRRGGLGYGGNEEYELMKCPACNFIYLYENEADTIFPDPNNLTECYSPNWADPINCTGCNKQLPQPWLVGDQMNVTWDEMRNSGWSWVVIRGF